MKSNYSIDKFQIADNPMRKNGNSTIIHLLEPKSMIIVFEGHITPKSEHYEHYAYTNSAGGKELFTFHLHSCIVTDLDSEKFLMTVNKLFRDAWFWYMAYMDWEDQQKH